MNFKLCKQIADSKEWNENLWICDRGEKINDMQKQQQQQLQNSEKQHELLLCVTLLTMCYWEPLF